MDPLSLWRHCGTVTIIGIDIDVSSGSERRMTGRDCLIADHTWNARALEKLIAICIVGGVRRGKFSFNQMQK